MPFVEKARGLVRHSIEKIETNEKSPYIHVEKHPEMEHNYYAFFGIRMDSLINMCHLEHSQSHNLIYEQLKMIQCLLTGNSNQSIQLRYVVQPNKDNWTKGKIDIAMIVRHIASSHDDAVLSGRDSWKNTSPLLDTAASHYDFSPL